MNQTTFVTIVYELDLRMLILQVISAYRNFNHSQICEYIIVNNGRAVEDEKLREYLSRFLSADFFKKVRLINSKNILTDIEYAESSGQRTQQILKLRISKFINTKSYVILDAKNFFVRKSDLSLFISNEKYLTILSSYISEYWQPYIKNSLSFFNIDDRQMLERYILGYKNSDVDILSGFCDVFEHSSLNNSYSIPVEYTSLVLGGGLEVNLSINMFGKGSFIIRKDLFDEIGGYEVDNSAIPMVDYRFYLKAALHGAKISIVPYAQYYYRKNSPKSLFYTSGNNRDQKFLAKTSIQKIFEDKLGKDIATAISPMIWDVSLPVFN